jgi:hypothetical protein
MTEPRRVDLRLEAVISDQQPISGLVRADDGRALAFSGWSEMFAVLQTLTSGLGDGTQTDGTQTEAEGQIKQAGAAG